MGREATGCEHRRRRTRSWRIRARGSAVRAPRRSAPTSNMSPSTPRCGRSTSTTRASMRRRSRPQSRRARGRCCLHGPFRRPPRRIARAAEADGGRRRGPREHRGPAADDLPPSGGRPRVRVARPRPVRRDARGRPAGAATAVCDRRCRHQGRRGRKRRACRRRRPARWQRRHRSALPPGQAGRGVRARGVPAAQPGATPRPAGRRGQRRMQAASDILLGWTTGPQGRQYYARQLQDQKAGAVIDRMSIDDVAQWGTLCGWALARGHARSGEPSAIAGYLGDDGAVADAIAAFGVAYADQTERDHAALLAAIRAGRINAGRGPAVAPTPERQADGCPRGAGDQRLARCSATRPARNSASGPTPGRMPEARLRSQGSPMK